MNLALAKLKTFICFPLYQVKKVRVKTLVYWFGSLGLSLPLIAQWLMKSGIPRKGRSGWVRDVDAFCLRKSQKKPARCRLGKIKLALF